MQKAKRNISKHKKHKQVQPTSTHQKSTIWSFYPNFIHPKVIILKFHEQYLEL